MPLDTVNVTPRVISASLVAPPQPLYEQQALRLLFSDVSLPNQLPLFASTPDGGATLSNPALQRHLQIAPGLRQVQLNVELSAQRTAAELVALLQQTHARFPVEHYLAAAISLISHIPLSAETASALMERAVFKQPAALDMLGPGRVAAGIRVILAGAGQTFITLEPLVGDPGVLLLQVVENTNGPLHLNEVAGRIESILRYNDNQLRQFVGQIL